MKRFRGLLILLVLLALAAGHYLYWYAPRERAGSPEPGGLPARLLAAGAYDACFWVPYPHQNLGKLEGAVDDGAAWVGAVARIADLPPPVLPSFGPFTVPPSSEIAGCSDLSGKRFLLVAKVYPALAAVSRLSGKLAGNPWLAGGAVEDVAGDESEPSERAVTVAWREGYWTVTSGEAPDLKPPPAATAPAAARPESLGIFRLLRDVSEFPLGEYALRRQGEDLVLALDQAPNQDNPPPTPEPDLPPQSHPVLLAVAGPAWPASEPKPLPPAAFALFELDEASRGARISSLGSLPGAAVFNAPGEEQRWGLPAQGIAGLVRKSLPQGNVAGWKIVAVDAASLERARELAPRISRLTSPEPAGSQGAPRDGGRLVLGLWAQPRPALQVVVEVRKILEGLPLVSRAQVRRWKDWEILLRPLARCEGLELTATQGPPSFRLALERCGKP
ncbi:MAG TPA: hypothetical protein VEW48_07085 [Thermoanaerobaculia bacterium]|nr:hypothetical protein [Thermoanaerobaculia bacterium]